MELTILDASFHPNCREVTLMTTTGAQWQITEGRDGTLVVSAGVPLEVEPYSFGTIVIRQVEMSLGLTKKETT